ncbi:MAG: alpha/beta hydrolase [Acidimicrobiaceae bacterium]|nr:alpha/beta hydrolase [Acidimicrobiaceae bacterium]
MESVRCVTKRFDTASGVQIEADFWGEKSEDAVVLLHGGGQTRHSWGSTASEIAQKGWWAISVDLRGHGRSSWVPDQQYGLDGFAADIDFILQEEEIVPVLVGASLGGLTGMYLAGNLRPKSIRSLVLVDIVPRMNRTGAERVKSFMLEHLQTGFATLEEAAEAIAAYNPEREMPTGLEGLKKNLHKRDGRWYWHWDPAFLETSNTKQRVEMQDPEFLNSLCLSIAAPMLLVRGRLSDLVTEVEAAEFLKEFPDASYVDVSGAGHMVAGDKNDIFTQAVIDFLDTPAE